MVFEVVVKTGAKHFFKEFVSVGGELRMSVLDLFRAEHKQFVEWDLSGVLELLTHLPELGVSGSLSVDFSADLSHVSLVDLNAQCISDKGNSSVVVLSFSWEGVLDKGCCLRIDVLEVLAEVAPVALELHREGSLGDFFGSLGEELVLVELLGELVCSPCLEVLALNHVMDVTFSLQ